MPKTTVARLCFGLCALVLAVAALLMVRGGHSSLVSLLLIANSLAFATGNIIERRARHRPPPGASN